jgi:putative toxin-antitoxin system antitoxin component (TIGR02293 family)
MAAVPNVPEISIEQAIGVAEVARILGVHARTMERRRVSGRTPRPLEIQREAKLRRIWRELTTIFTPENAAAWLKNPVPALENRSPVDIMAEDGGLDRVLDVIGRMTWGIPS